MVGCESCYSSVHMSSGHGGEGRVSKYSGFIDTFGSAPLYRLLARSVFSPLPIFSELAL